MSIGKLESVYLRELWKHEEYDFSSWLEKNIDTLSEAVEIKSLSLVQREKIVGSFQADLIAEDDDGNLVIIENQLEPTNHDHLGKLLTYVTNLEAKTGIWITSEPRPEHIKAVAWLNERRPDDMGFYLVRIAAYRIENSDPAPLFTVVVAPSTKVIETGGEEEEPRRHKLRREFWGQLLARGREKGFSLFANNSPSKEMWLSTTAGKAGVKFNYLVWLEEKTATELGIDTVDKDQNKRIFDHLYSKKGEIETSFGSELIWERLDDKRTARIRHIIKKGGLLDGEKNWTSIQDAMIDSMDRLSKALKPHIQAIPE